MNVLYYSDPKLVEFSADDEEPKCLECDNVNTNRCDKCGPEHFWSWYRRTVPIKEILEDIVERSK